MKIALEAKKFTAKAQSKGRSPLTRRVAGPCTHILYENRAFLSKISQIYGGRAGLSGKKL